MRIGIIGVTGFIGTALARAAVARGHAVVAFSRRTDLSISGAEEVRPVAAQGPAIDPSGLDAIVNLAGESILGRWSRARKERIRDSRIALTRRIVKSLEGCRVRPGVLVNASATGIYGDRGSEMLPEASPRGAGFLAEVCAEWEAEAGRAESCGMRVVRLRTGMVLGRDGGAWPLLKRVFGLGLGGRLGSGKQWVPWIHLEDEIGIILHALENPPCAGPVNAASPNPVTNAEMTAIIAGLLKRPAFFHAPESGLRFLLGEFAGVLLDSQRVEPRAARGGGYEFRYPVLRDALASLV
jgi:uncharacterized protein